MEFPDFLDTRPPPSPFLSTPAVPEKNIFLHQEHLFPLSDTNIKLQNLKDKKFPPSGLILQFL